MRLFFICCDWLLALDLCGIIGIVKPSIPHNSNPSRDEVIFQRMPLAVIFEEVKM